MAQDSTLIMRIDKETKEQFKQICDEQDKSYSKVLRTGIKQYIKEVQDNELNNKHK